MGDTLTYPEEGKGKHKWNSWSRADTHNIRCKNKHPKDNSDHECKGCYIL